jgi:hypothetical protein
MIRQETALFQRKLRFSPTFLMSARRKGNTAMTVARHYRSGFLSRRRAVAWLARDQGGGGGFVCCPVRLCGR